jgi:predicted nucleic-acid-binding protein
VIADADVLLRIIDGESSAHSRAARTRVQAARDQEPIGVLAATVLEIAFVLESSAAGYGWTRASVASAVQAIVDEPGFVVEHADALRAAAITYRNRAFDLHGCYLDAIARERGVRVLSFDKDFVKLGSGERP